AHRLLLLEHPPTYTFGRRGKLDNLLFNENELAQQGITTHWVDRGGDVTYHGPGQLVGYPILNLARLQDRDFPDVHRYLRDIEEVIITTLGQLSIEAWRYPGYTGVWVNEQHNGQQAPHKIAAIGVKVSGKAISSHGFALNVNPNLAHFAGIIPCGISEHPVTSVAQHGQRLTVADIVPQIVMSFGRIFDLKPSLQTIM
ncbi:MAG: lipoyl(octanoyl) transferase LipB, partial [Candidatus Promineifilaceae bacterium]